MRHILAAVMAAGFLAACATPTATTPQSIIIEAVTAAQGLDGMLNTLSIEDPTLIPATVLTQAQATLANAEAASAILVAGMPTIASAPTIKTVQDAINSVLTMLAGPPVNGLIPAPFNQAVAAAALIAPMMEVFVAPYIPNAAASPAVVIVQSKLRASAPQITTADQAVAALQKYAAH